MKLIFILSTRIFSKGKMNQFSQILLNLIGFVKNQKRSMEFKNQIKDESHASMVKVSRQYLNIYPMVVPAVV